MSGYRLMGGQPDTLQSLQNQRVEIRGSFDDSSAAANPSATAAGSTMRTLRITSIRPVPGDCGAKQ